MKNFSFKTGLWTLFIYTAILSVFAVARGTAGSADFLQRVLLVAVSGFLVGYFLDPLARAVPGSYWRRFGILALLIFSVATISNALETILYLPTIAVAGTIGGGIIQTVILAGVLARVTKPASSEHSKEIRLQFNRSILYLFILAVIWLPVYFLFVALDTPVVHMLLQGKSNVYSQPSMGTMIGLELIRGLLHAAVMLGIVVLARGRQRVIWLWGALAIAILNGWLPILPTSTLPFGIRIANGVEITLSSITFAGIAALLLFLLKASKNKATN